MPQPRTIPTSDAQRRELQSQIERSRRRLERNIGRLVGSSLSLGSWQDYVTAHPVRSLLAAAGVGLALSGLVSRLPLPRNLVEQVASLAMGAGWQEMFAEIRAALDQARHGGPSANTNG